MRLFLYLGSVKNNIKQASAFLVTNMSAVFTAGITTLVTIVKVIGGGVAAWGAMNLMEGYGTDNPGSKSQGIKQVVAGGGLYLIGENVVSKISF